MNDIANTLFMLFTRYGYGAVFAGVMLDNAGIPMASEITLLLSGSLVADGTLAWLPTILVGAVAALCSDGLWYGIGRLGARRLIHVYCHFSFGSAACLSRTETMLTRLGPRSLILARFIPGFRTFAAPVVGISGMPLRQFLLYDGIGALLWASVFVSLGALFTQRIRGLIGQMESAHNGLLVFAATLLALFVLMKIWVRVRHGRADIALATMRSDEP
ncbi:MAG: hypothetical protein AUJ86_03700 [Hydrogenophilaceae bacterium CG1_02_62_390]|nr:MAG: hypothetical protein AUJ86_03700 [Hydrogenophilaceae bacterium CG1_02_62_390]PIW38046.1 MAG: hypothetical protein COW23_08600 [Hydrogenophilales bacterium CG15_BIG_FIL_POST_REV_8_21_14_020_62_31]